MYEAKNDINNTLDETLDLKLGMHTHDYSGGWVSPGHMSFSGHVNLKIPKRVLRPNPWPSTGPHLAIPLSSLNHHIK